MITTWVAEAIKQKKTKIELLVVTAKQLKQLALVVSNWGTIAIVTTVGSAGNQ